jgi:hypothetical protein
MATSPTSHDMHELNIYLRFTQESMETVPKQRPPFCPIISLDRSQNYESNRTSFIIFGATNREI